MIRQLILMIIIIGTLLLPLNVLAENSSMYKGTSRNDRLSNAVSEQQIVLDEATKLATQTKCKAAQDILKGYQATSDKPIIKRLDLYGTIQKELQAIKLRMIRQGADASETDLLTGKLQQALDNFTIQADKYGTSLDDVINVDCVQKPEQFKASLVLLRAQRLNILNSAMSLKSTMLNAQNSVFDQLKKRLVI